MYNIGKTFGIEERIKKINNNVELDKPAYIKIPAGYELKELSDTEFLLEKEPEYELNTVVHLSKSYYGYISHYANERASVVVYVRFEDMWMLPGNTNLIADELRPADENEKSFFYDILHGFCVDIENNKKIDYICPAEKVKYSIGIENGEYVIWNNNKGIYGFETFRAADVCRNRLEYNKKWNNERRNV